jgi:hypothetical protein
MALARNMSRCARRVSWRSLREQALKLYPCLYFQLNFHCTRLHSQFLRREEREVV